MCDLKIHILNLELGRRDILGPTGIIYYMHGSP